VTYLVIRDPRTVREVLARPDEFGPANALTAAVTALAPATLRILNRAHFALPPVLLAFGHGVYRCLGARLAELEATLVIGTTARLLPVICLTGPASDWLGLLSFRAFRSVADIRRPQ
jgi:cytochrome P450